jgi:hypothetical protein
MIERAEVVTAARRWIGTPFQHQQRARTVAVDCAGLIIGVGRELGVWPATFDVIGYPAQPDGRTIRALCDQHLVPVPVDQVGIGHVVIIAWGVTARISHLGFVADYVHGGQSFIHANQHVGGVREHRMMLHAGMLMHAAYALPGVEG